MYIIPIETVTIDRIRIIPITGDTPLLLSIKFLLVFDGIMDLNKVIYTLIYNILLQQMKIVVIMTA